MRFIATIAALILVLLGCAPNQDESRRSQNAERAATGTTQDPFVGDYYQGDGLGYNLHLTLKPDGSFNCQWSGCLGDYGSTSGTCHHNADKITINATISRGMFADRPLGNMTIVKHDGMDRLLLDTDADLLKDREMLPFFSFGRVKPEEGRTKR